MWCNLWTRSKSTRRTRHGDNWLLNEKKYERKEEAFYLILLLLRQKWPTMKMTKMLQRWNRNWVEKIVKKTPEFLWSGKENFNLAAFRRCRRLPSGGQTLRLKHHLAFVSKAKCVFPVSWDFLGYVKFYASKGDFYLIYIAICSAQIRPPDSARPLSAGCDPKILLSAISIPQDWNKKAVAH